MPGAVRSVLWKMNPGLATLRRLFDAVCLKFCESNDPLMEASPLPEWWAKCDPGAARQQCTMNPLFTLHTVNSAKKMYKMLWVETEDCTFYTLYKLYKLYTEYSQNVQRMSRVLLEAPAYRRIDRSGNKEGRRGVANKKYHRRWR